MKSTIQAYTRYSPSVDVLLVRSPPLSDLFLQFFDPTSFSVACSTWDQLPPQSQLSWVLVYDSIVSFITKGQVSPYIPHVPFNPTKQAIGLGGT